MSDETKLDRALQHLNKYALGSRVVKEEVSDRRVHLCLATHHCIIERSKRSSIQFALDRHVKVGCLFKLWRFGLWCTTPEVPCCPVGKVVCVIISYGSGDNTKVIKNQDNHEMGGRCMWASTHRPFDFLNNAGWLCPLTRDTDASASDGGEGGREIPHREYHTAMRLGCRQ